MHGEYSKTAAAPKKLNTILPSWRRQLRINRMAQQLRIRGMNTAIEPSKKPYKIPRSTLIVIHTPVLEVLLIERADRPGYWQSVTGSQDKGETLAQTAARELAEETGLIASEHVLTNWHKRNEYEIYKIWRHRYAPGVTHNVEHVFSLRVPTRVPIVLAPHEHLQHVWLPYEKAADLCFSPTNRDAILQLPGRVQA
jgi:dihydroneopterin triphosphate diphosphatase